VESVEADLDNDRLHVQYDSARITPQELLRSVAQQGFAATVVPGAAEAPPR
jgi:copper chaperone CopZ